MKGLVTSLNYVLTEKLKKGDIPIMQIRQNWPNILTLQGSLTRHWSFLYFWIGVQKLIWWRVYQWFNVSRDSQIMKGYIQRPPKDGWKALFSSSVVLGNPFSTLFCCNLSLPRQKELSGLSTFSGSTFSKSISITDHFYTPNWRASQTIQKLCLCYR